MPIFEYRCGKCGELFEELVRGASQKVVCPSCGSADLEKLISAIAGSCGGCEGCGGGSSGGPT